MLGSLSALARRRIGAVALFWAILIVVASLLSTFVSDSQGSRSDWWKPFDANPPLFSLGLLMLTSGILAAAFLGSQHEYRPWKIAVSSALALAGLGTCIVSVVPGKGSIAVRDSVDGVSDQVGGNSFGIPVLFANNKDEVSDAERRALERAVLIFKECGTANIRVVGFASSASFPNDSDSLNNLLANRRAISVVKALEKLGIKAEPHAWGSYPEMARARRVIDSQGRQRLLSEEVRNRRAELIWRESPCSGL